MIACTASKTKSKLRPGRFKPASRTIPSRWKRGRAKPTSTRARPWNCIAATDCANSSSSCHRWRFARAQDKAERTEYASFVIDEINPKDETIRFKNGVEIGVGQTQGADQAALFREQIRYTVGEHFRKQKRLKEAGIKVISLFFIDRVDNYTGDGVAAADSEGLYPGIIRKLFDEAFDELKENFPDFAPRKADEVRKAYFAQKKRRGGETEAMDSTGKSAGQRHSLSPRTSVPPQRSRRVRPVASSLETGPDTAAEY